MAKTTEDMGQKPTACVDLDGVLNTYDGWKGENHFAQPRTGVHDFLLNLGADFEIVVHTTRDPEKTRKWLKAHQLWSLVEGVSRVKPPAVVYIDDRAVQFNGDYDEALEAARSFAPFWQE